MDHIRKICEYLYVTPHYLLGFVSDPAETLIFDKNGHPVKQKDENGNEVDVTLVEPMLVDPPACVKANEDYANLFIEDSELYWLIRDLIRCPVLERNKCKNRLRELIPKKYLSK